MDWKMAGCLVFLITRAVTSQTSLLHTSKRYSAGLPVFCFVFFLLGFNRLHLFSFALWSVKCFQETYLFGQVFSRPFRFISRLFFPRLLPSISFYVEIFLSQLAQSEGYYRGNTLVWAIVKLIFPLLPRCIRRLPLVTSFPAMFWFVEVIRAKFLHRVNDETILYRVGVK